MIEVRFTTDAFPMVAVTAEVYVKGRTPKIARCGGALSGLYDAQSSDCHLFDGELSVFVDCNKGKTAPLYYSTNSAGFQPVFLFLYEFFLIILKGSNFL